MHQITPRNFCRRKLKTQPELKAMVDMEIVGDEIRVSGGSVPIRLILDSLGR
jgi:hypothetical protein